MTTGKIDGTKLLIYADGEPIGVTTDLSFDPMSHKYESVLGPEQSGTFKFEPLELSDEYYLNYIIRQIRQLPRKKKKRVKRLLEKGYTMNVTFR